jgi:hypothetical protein
MIFQATPEQCRLQLCLCYADDVCQQCGAAAHVHKTWKPAPGMHQLRPVDASTVEAKNDREDHVAAGDVSVAEAREILLRFCASHFDAHRQTDREKARMSIPANPLRDDDIRLGAFISRAEKAFAALAAADALRDCLGTKHGSKEYQDALRIYEAARAKLRAP